MLAAGIELEIRPLMPYEHLDLDRADVLPLATRIRRDDEMVEPDVVFVHTLPFDCERVVKIAGFVERDGESTYRTPHSLHSRLVAYTTWEGMSRVPPQFVRSLYSGCFQHVYMPSRSNVSRMLDGIRAAALPSIPFEVGVLPHAFDPAIIPKLRGPKSPAAPDRYRFYYVGAWNGRKNPAGVIRAYISAFEPTDNVELVMHCAHCSDVEFIITAHSSGLERHQMPKIDWHGGFVSDEEMWALHRDADCFVTATRGEAWNLPAFDAMLAGRHMIVPTGMGHDDFLLPGTGGIEGTSVSAYGGMIMPAQGDVRIGQPQPGQSDNALNLQFVGAHGLTGKSQWMEPSLYELASKMKEVAKSGLRDLRWSYDAAARYSYEVVGKQLRASLEAL
jgi:glycosyltransferase involved in cell wall biosynthesis